MLFDFFVHWGRLHVVTRSTTGRPEVERAATDRLPSGRRLVSKQLGVSAINLRQLGEDFANNCNPIFKHRQNANMLQSI